MSRLSVLPAVGLSLTVMLGSVAWGPGVSHAQTPPQTAPLTSGTPAANPARIKALTDTLMIGDVMEVMREEGLAYGRTLATEMFPGKSSAQWEATVELIYDPATMRGRFEAGLATALEGAEADLTEIEAFFGSEVGQSVLRLEVEARRALLDPLAEDAAKLAWEDLRDTGGARADQLARFVEANDLIESNVMGAMNSNLAFYRGLAESGAFPAEMTEDQMLADVWSQEPDVRAETTDWLYPYLNLAYQPLGDEALDSYSAFSESAAGDRLNGALFAAFDDVFTQISYDLGRAAATQMQGEDI